jgi:hypothetical protein
VLCEKPIAKDSKIVERFTKHDKLFMVNNWSYLYSQAVDNIFYNYFNTGKDGLWDFIKPVSISRTFAHSNTCPIFQCEIDGKYYTQKDFDKTYVDMIFDFYHSRYDMSMLMNIKTAIKAHQKIERWIENVKSQIG